MSKIDKNAANIEYAYILFGNGLEKIVPVSTIPRFFSKNRKDFNKEQKLKVWWYGKGDKDDYLYNANILLLGTSEADIQAQKMNTRVKYPNKRNMSFSKSDLRQQAPNLTARSKSKTKKRSCKKIKLPTVEATKYENDQILKKHAALMTSRKSFNESASEESEPERNEGEGFGTNSPYEEESPIPDKEERHVALREKEFETIVEGVSDEQNSHERDNRYYNLEERSRNKRTDEISHQETSSKRNDVDQEIVQTGSNSPLLRQRTNSRDTIILSNAEEELDDSNHSNNYSAGNSRINRSWTVRRTVSRQLFPGQELVDNNCDNLTTSNERRSHIPRRIGPRLGPNVQNPINRDDDDMVYLGENISVHIDIWETMLAKNDSKFIRDLTEVIWGREVLKQKCLKAERANKDAENLSPNSLRTELTPTKYKLLKDCLYQKITAAKVTGKVTAARMRRVWQYLSKKIYYLRTKKST